MIHTCTQARSTHIYTHVRALGKNTLARASTYLRMEASDEATPFNRHNDWGWELVHAPGHKFVIKVASAEGEESMQDPQQVCGASGAYECQQLESASLQQWRNEWPAL